MSKPKLALIPSGYKSGKVYSILPNDATGDFDFERQSIGTRVRKDGLIEEAKTSGSITNELLYSEEFTGLNWANVNTTITADQELAPNGTNTADKIARTSTSSSYTAHTISKSSTAKKFTTSVYLKKGSHDYFALRTQGSYPSRVDIRFRFDTEQIYYAQAVSNFTLYDYGVEVLANDWYRLHYTYETDTHSSISVSFSPRHSDGNIDSSDSGSTAHAFVWGAMVSEGALSDYIKTEGTTETKRVETFTDVPRLDWLNSNCPSLLLERQSTNLITYSEDFSEWSATNIVLTEDLVISPDGTTTADKIAGTSVTSQHRVNFTSTNVSGATTFSFFAKSGEYTSCWARIGFSNAYFDLENGVSIEGSGITSSIENYGNGWYRCIMTKASSSANEVCRINITTSYLDTSDFLGDNTSGIYLWGAQLEQASYPTSYIKTEGSTVTRLKDECLNGGDANLFNITEGSWFLDLVPFENSSAQREIYIHDGTNNNRLVIQFQSNNIQVRYLVASGGSVQVSLYEPITINTRNKILVTFKQNDFKIYINGTLEGTDTSGNVPIGLDTFNFANVGETFNFEGKVYDTRVYDRVLTEAEAIELTT